MGLKLRYNLFYNTTAEAVYGAFETFYNLRRRPLIASGWEHTRIDFHHEDNGWVVVDLDGGWEWKERREAQFFVSQSLYCAGFLVFVCDGDYWGYEFFDRGVSVDHFVQDSGGQPIGFPGEDCRGNAQVVVEHLPFLQMSDVAPYLIQKHDFEIPVGMNEPARPGGQFHRFDECCVLDFLRMLGVGVNLLDDHVCLDSPIFRSVFKNRE